MAVLFIRKYDRFAMRQNVNLALGDGTKGKGLLIEISMGGCRISHIGKTSFEDDAPVTVTIKGYGKIECIVRWSHDDILGLRWAVPLRSADLSDLITTCREQTGYQPAMTRFGT